MKLSKIARSSVCVALVFALGIASTVSSFAISSDFQTRTNISTQALTWSSEKGDLPASISEAKGGEFYWFNIQCRIRMKKATLWIKPVGSSGFKKEYSFKANNYCNWVNYKYKFDNNEGVFIYKWEVQATNGDHATFPEKSITIHATKGNRKDASYYEGKVGSKVSNTSSGVQCVEYIKIHARERGKILPAHVGNGKDVYINLQGSYTTSQTPRTDSIACFANGKYGHVIYVDYYDNVNDIVYYSEANSNSHRDGYLYKDTLSKFKKRNANFQGFVYL